MYLDVTNVAAIHLLGIIAERVNRAVEESVSKASNGSEAARGI
jgi:hypothetical protein